MLSPLSSLNRNPSFDYNNFPLINSSPPSNSTDGNYSPPFTFASNNFFSPLASGYSPHENSHNAKSSYAGVLKSQSNLAPHLILRPIIILIKTRLLPLLPSLITRETPVLNVIPVSLISIGKLSFIPMDAPRPDPRHSPLLLTRSSPPPSPL